jgi:hypothetical protein
MLAFRELSRERRIMPDCVIPITRKAIREWSREYGFLDDEDFYEELVDHIEAMDAYFCKYERDLIAERNRSGSDGKPPKLREENAGVRRGHSEATERD